MNCKNCQIELEQIKGKKAKVFCSDKCRMAFNRKLISEQPMPNKSNTNISEQANPNTEDFIKKYGEFCNPNGTRIVGKCRWCGLDITKEVYGTYWDLVECCYGCTKKRNETITG